MAGAQRRFLDASVVIFGIVSAMLSLSLASCSSRDPDIATRLKMTAQPADVSLKSRPAATWAMYQGRPSHNAVFRNPKISASWVVQLREKINGGLSVVGSTLFADSFDHNIYALDVGTGRMLWKTTTDNVIMSTPVVGDDVLVVGTGKDGWLNPDAQDASVQIWGRPGGDNIFALSAKTGKPLWRYHTVGDDMASAAIDGNAVVFANGDLHAYALDLHRGTLRWRIPILGVASMDSVTIDNHVAFIGSCRIAPHACETAAIDVRNGHVNWRSDIGSADASPAVAGGVVVTNMLLLDESGKYDQGGRSTLAGLDESSGNVLWKWTSKDGPCTFVGSGEHGIAPLIDGRIVIDAIGCRSEVVAVDLKTSKLRWIFRTFAHVKMSPIAYDGHVFFGDTNGVFYDVNEKSGEANRYVSFDQLFTTSPFVIVGKTLFAACGSEIYALPIERAFSPLSVPLHDVWIDNPISNVAS